MSSCDSSRNGRAHDRNDERAFFLAARCVLTSRRIIQPTGPASWTSTPLSARVCSSSTTAPAASAITPSAGSSPATAATICASRRPVRLPSPRCSPATASRYLCPVTHRHPGPAPSSSSAQRLRQPRLSTPAPPPWLSCSPNCLARGRLLRGYCASSRFQSAISATASSPAGATTSGADSALARSPHPSSARTFCSSTGL